MYHTVPLEMIFKGQRMLAFLFGRFKEKNHRIQVGEAFDYLALYIPRLQICPLYIFGKQTKPQMVPIGI